VSNISEKNIRSAIPYEWFIAFSVDMTKIVDFRKIKKIKKT
jgi:hypothetical protein